MHPPQIPLTPQTNPQSFPTHDPKAPPGKSGHPYPRMLTKEFTKEDRDLWLERNQRMDRNTREIYYEERVPRVGTKMPIKVTQALVDADLADVVGADVVVANEADEKKVLELLGLAAAAEKQSSSFEVGQTETLEQVLSTPAEKLQAENDKLRALLAERDKLQRELAGGNTPPSPAELRAMGGAPKQRRTRGPNKPKQAAPAPTPQKAKQTPLQRVRAMSAAQLAGDEG